MKKSFAPLLVTGGAQTYQPVAPKISKEAAEAKFGVTIDRTLKESFGHSTFRGFQRDVVLSVLSGSDTFVLMPTGGGKSLCFQLPALILEGVSLVVSPLIALMQDQVSALRAKGIAAEMLNSAMTEKERKRVLSDLSSMKIATRLLYVTPEMISTDHFSSLLDRLNKRGLLASFVVDESHCISKWGVGFRPDYRKLDVFKGRFPSVPIIALTATATKTVREDIVSSLNLQSPQLFITSFNRPNISYEVRFKDLLADVKGNLRDFVKANLGDTEAKDSPTKGCGIVYCHKRADCDEVAAYLKGQGFRAEAYHAGENAKNREAILSDFLKGRVDVAVATIAFGMGIDRASVRFVVHYTLPSSVEDFYQESGRAGRDGLPAKSLVYYSDTDRSLKEFLCRQTTAHTEEEKERRTEIKLKAFKGVVEYCTEAACRRKMLLAYFGESTVTSGRNICNRTCDYCLDNGKRFREMVDELSMPKYSISEFEGRRIKSYFADDEIDDSGYDSIQNPADTDDHGEGYGGFMLANGLKRANSALGHFKRVASAPKFDPSGESEEFFNSYKKAEQEFSQSRSAEPRTIGLRRAGFVGTSSVTSGFTQPKAVPLGTKKPAATTILDLDAASPPKPEKRPRESEPASPPPQKKARTSDFVPGSTLSSLFKPRAATTTRAPTAVIEISDSPAKKVEKKPTTWAVVPIEIDEIDSQ